MQGNNEMQDYNLNREASEDKGYTIWSVNIVENKISLIREPEMSGNVKLLQDSSAIETMGIMINDAIAPEYREAARDFSDIVKWPERFKRRSSDFIVYLDVYGRWKRAWTVPSKLDCEGNVTEAIMCVRDITDEKDKEARQHEEIEAARTDQLTGFGNRSAFYDIIKSIEVGTVNLPGQFGIAFIDINGLKERNDATGHESGDHLILEIASIIVGIFDRKYVFRHGGDEFILISFDNDEFEFESKLAILSTKWNDVVSAAVGGVWVTDVSRIDEAIIRADQRMYMDKNRFYMDRKNDRRLDHPTVKLDMGLNYVPFEGITFGNEKRYFYVTDLTTNITRFSANTLEYFDLSSDILTDVQKEWLSLVHPNDRDGLREDLRKVTSGEKQFHEMDYRIRNRFGQYITCTCRGKVISNPGGDGYLFVGSVENHEISELYDSVTGLSNVFSFIQDTIQHLRYPGNELLVVVGINDFSLINQKHGYEFGNAVLRMFADKLRTFKIDMSHAYRLDGTKFCIAVKKGTIEEGREIFEDLKRVARKGFLIGSTRIIFSISGGAVIVDKSKKQDEHNIQASLAYVMEQSKHHKHSEFVVFNNDIVDKNRENMSLLECLRNSVYNDMEGFYMCYQPVVSAKTGKISGAEALVRWNMEPFGEVSPAVFIPLLESSPCFFELGEWIFMQALTDAREMISHNPDFVINVNVSAEQIERSGFRDSVSKILKRTQFPAKNLCMELTERVISLDLKYLRGELEYFKSLGIQIALDDFGTGVSSMNLLLEIPADQIKIDRKFVRDIVTNPIEQAIVESIALCANKLGLDICVEGIENEEMRDFLMKYHVTKHQGYFYSRPIVYNKIIEFLDRV